MNLPKRKNLRLKEYNYSENGCYFVTICIQDMKCILGDIVGATLRGRPNNPHRIIEKWLLETQNKFNDVIIDKYVIMPNHIHAIIMLTGDHTGSPLPTIIDWYKTMTTNEYIRGVKNNLFPRFNKRFWQRSYHEHIIRGQNDYDNIWQYIDQNPLKWELDKYYTKP